MTVVRRRRSRRHRRNRRIRPALAIFTCAAFTFAISCIALRYLSPSLFHEASNTEPNRKVSEAGRNLFLSSHKEALSQIEGRSIYRYSVVPGGVRTVAELKWAVEHDPVVAAHYAGFDYDHARVVKLVLARTAYISYRIGNRVYWTRHRVSLRKGETVITDGRIIGRTRCANRVEEMPQQATSESEPPAASWDEPIQPMNAPPVPFQSALMNRNPVPGVGPAIPLSTYDAISNGGIIPLLPAPLPGLCGIGVKKKPKDSAVGTLALSTAGKRKKIDPCDPGEGGGGGGGEVPEPGTWLLMGSGVAGLYWKARHKLSRLSSTESQ